MKIFPAGLICAVGAIIAMVGMHATADATIINFTIGGTYDETLQDKTGNHTLFSAGDSFNILGSYDNSLQPSLETKGNGIVTLVDVNVYGMIIDYSSIVSLTSDIPLADINNYYPSADHGIGTGFNNYDYKNGRYFTDTNYLGGMLSLDIYSNYTHLFLQDAQGILSGSLKFNYHETSEQSGDFTLYNWANDTINLNVTGFQTSPVPEPASMLLFGAGLAGLVSTRIRRRKKKY
ncbi:MAG: PEP-CTERM sorting domain-containing protein [Nitrospirae bacterium]|nr:PEP-CTERM sorting domain-containing protein [Nitrospirota bacterium]